MLAIKKRVNLDFLGEEWKEAHILFRSIPLKDYEELMKEAEVKKDAIKFTRSTLKKYYLSGKVPNDKGELGDMKI